MLYIIGYMPKSELVILQNPDMLSNRVTLTISEVTNMIADGFPIGFYDSITHSVASFADRLSWHFSSRGVDCRYQESNSGTLLILRVAIDSPVSLLGMLLGMTYFQYSQDSYALRIADYKTVKMAIKLWYNGEL